MCGDVNICVSVGMLRVEVTAALGIITMNFFFHFNCRTGPALATLLPSQRPRESAAQRMENTIARVNRVQIS